METFQRFQLGFESNLRFLWFCITTPHDWPEKLAPHSRPTSSKTKTNHDLLERLNGVNRQPSNGQKGYCQPSKKREILPTTVKKADVISCQTVLRSSKSHYYCSCSSRTAGSQRIVLTGTTSFHVPKYTR